MIARHLVIVCLIYMALVFQTSLSNGSNQSAIQPWLPGLALAACVLLTDSSASLVWAGLLGLGVDCLADSHLGVNLIVTILVVSGLVALRRETRSQGIMMIGISLFAGTFLWRTAIATINAHLDRRPIDLSQLIIVPLTSAFSSTLIVVSMVIVGRMAMTIVRGQPTSSVSLANRWSMLTGE
jgi:rod shape-determining protein MreD